MMEMDISRIIKQDMKAIYSAFKNEDFRNMNVFSNRIITDAIFADKSKFIIVGFFLKDMALIYKVMKAKKELTTFTTAKSFGDNFIRSIIDDDIELEIVWVNYHRFRISMMEHQQNEHEKNNYSQNFDFSHMAFVQLIDMLKNEKNILLINNNQFLHGMNSEMERIFKVHGANLDDFYAMALTGSLGLYYGYAEYYGSAREDFIEKSIFPHIDNVSEVLEKDPVDQKEVENLLVKLLSEWRYSYIRFMERPKFIPIKEDREVSISEETKKKISDTVAKVLEQEVK